MEQQLDAFTQKRFELIIEMATKKLQQEMDKLKESLCSMAGEINSLKSQVSRIQFQPPQHAVQKTLGEIGESSHQAAQQPKKEAKIVDCRPEDEKKAEFTSGSARNSEPVRPRFGDYKSEDVSIDKFFYFGNKRSKPFAPIINS